MKPTRRELLVGLGAAGAAAVAGCGDEEQPGKKRGSSPAQPAPDRLPEPAQWAAPGAEDPTAFPYGVQAGDPHHDRVLLSIRTAETGCRLVVVAEVEGAWVEAEQRLGLDPTGASIQAEVSGLLPDTAYRYTLYAADDVRRSAIGRFRTAVDPGGFRKLVIAATSCLGSANPEFASLSALAAAQPDLCLLLGDTVYADGNGDLDRYRMVWNLCLQKQAVRDLTASTAVVATWDDHEVDNNWRLGLNVDQQQVDDALQAFREAIPMGVGPGGSGLWRKLSWGAIADIFVLDSRGERNWVSEVVSQDQLEWIVKELAASTAQFKLVMCSVHLTDHSTVMGPVEDMDRWQGYPQQREALIQACEQAGGVIVVTGDMHYGGIQWVGRPGEPGSGIVEVAAGPAGSRLNPYREIVGLAVEPPPQYELLVDGWTGSLITLDPGTGEAHCVFVDDAGTVVGEFRWTV